MKVLHPISPKEIHIDSPVQAKRSSGTEILESIRKHKTKFPDETFEYENKTPVPDLNPEELKKQFIQNLKNAGANVIESPTDAVETTVASLWNNVLDFSKPEICAEYSASSPLEKLDKIEHLILHGNFGVAENGAIWLEDKDFPHRILPFITQHLIILMNANAILPNMQDAYKQIDLSTTGFGLFISGPSKTADIEQSLVYGAHGAKELTVILQN